MVEDGLQWKALAEWFYAMVLAWGAIAAFVALVVMRARNVAREWAESKAAHADHARAICALKVDLANHAAASKESLDTLGADLRTLRSEVVLKPDRPALDNAIERVEAELSALAASSHAEARMKRQGLEGALDARKTAGAEPAANELRQLQEPCAPRETR